MPAVSAVDNASGVWRTNKTEFPDPTTWWIGQDFDAGNDQDIIEVALTRNFTTEAPLSFTVRRSTDGSAWTNVWNVPSISWTLGTLVFSNP